MANATLAYSTARINRDYRIKVAGIDNNGNKINTLVGVSGPINLSALNSPTSLSVGLTAAWMITAIANCVAVFG